MNNLSSGGALPAEAPAAIPTNTISIVTEPPGQWVDGKLPANVQLGVGTVLKGQHVFQRFQSKLDPAVIMGQHCTMDGAHFSIGEKARVRIGDYCYFTHAILVCEAEIQIGDYVVMGWNATICDSDFHPISPAERIRDIVACRLGESSRRPPIPVGPVIIEHDVWIGPNATILKGVRIGSGALIEPGALVTRSVPPRSRVLGNPARVVGTL